MIPKKIHYCWLGGNPLPDSAKKCIKSWKKYCPDYEIIEWNETNYDFTQIPYMKEAYEAKKWGFVPDYARLDIIYQHGGIYLDTDVELLKPIDELLTLKGFAGFETSERINFGQGFGAEAGNSVIKKMMDSYQDMHFVHEDGTLDLTPSPQLNTEVFVSLGIKKDGSMQEIDGFKIFPVDYFCPKSFEDGIIRKTANTYSIHHFDASWYTAEEQKWKLDIWAAAEAREKKKRKSRRKKRIRNAIGRAVGAVCGDRFLSWLKTKLK